MKTITKEYVVLEQGDIEEVVSAQIGREVSISEISCCLTYYFDVESGMPGGMYLDFEIDGEYVDSYDVFFDEEKDIYCYKGKEFSLNEDFLQPDCIFGFDTKLFKKFKISADNSD